MKFVLIHTPTGKVCDVEDGVCYLTFDSEQDARDHVKTELAEYAQNYSVQPMPADLHSAQDGPTVDSLLALLRDVQRLGLMFDCGSAYIRRAYIDEQEALNKRIRVANLAACAAKGRKDAA